MDHLNLMDAAVLGIVTLASLRGLFLGVIREGFSIAALATACLVVRNFNTGVALWLVEVTQGQIAAEIAPWLTGIGLGLMSAGSVGLLGKALKRGATALGLSWADRLAGGFLGAAEGTLVAALVIFGITWVAGREHPVVAEARSLSVFERAHDFLRERDLALPQVASPPQNRHRPPDDTRQ